MSVDFENEAPLWSIVLLLAVALIIAPFFLAYDYWKRLRRKRPTK